ncbi:hypothetical protein DFJ77DRAFT_515477 [Powellomyces hirtus]|nr:hypothetical protein DFJ77DRAFT_515477 [Powellomyces hirtus]
MHPRQTRAPQRVPPIDASRGRRDAYGALLTTVNPNGTVPTLVLDDGTAVWKSGVIVTYLGETYGVDRGLYPPAGSSQRAEALKWIAWASTVLSAAASMVDCAAMAEKGRAGVDAGLRILEDAVGDAEAFDMEKYAHLSTWFKRIEERPALKNVE